jgi:hypothetical protein
LPPQATMLVHSLVSLYLGIFLSCYTILSGFRLPWVRGNLSMGQSPKPKMIPSCFSRHCRCKKWGERYQRMNYKIVWFKLTTWEALLLWLVPFGPLDYSWLCKGGSRYASMLIWGVYIYLRSIFRRVVDQCTLCKWHHSPLLRF